jgi:hypothetical protein
MSMKAIFVGLILTGAIFSADAENLTLRDLAPFRAAPASRQPSVSLVEAHCDRRSAIYVDGEALGLRVRTAIDGYLTVYSIGPTGDVSCLFPNAFNQGNFVRAGQEVEFPRPGALALVCGPFGGERIQIVLASGLPGVSSTIVQSNLLSLPASTLPASRPQFVLRPCTHSSPFEPCCDCEGGGRIMAPRL